MDKKTRIIVSGIGGIGGYYGGFLARWARETKDSKTEVDFLMHPGEHMNKVRYRGLLVQTPFEGFTAWPHRTMSNPQTLEPADYIILATKSYDLEKNIEELAPLLTPGTVVLPLLNGLDVHDQLDRLLPEGVVRWAGVAYITSRRVEPGLIRSTSKLERIFMGDPKRAPNEVPNEREDQLVRIMQEAGINAIVPASVMDEVRKKFLMLSNSAAATAYFDCTAGELLGKHLDFLVGLTTEIVNLYQAKGWQLEENPIEAALRRIERMPKDSTTSMHSDIKVGNRSEVESLVGYVMRESEQLGLDATYYRQVYEKLSSQA